MESPEPSSACSICNKPTSAHCKTCTSIFYCSPKCQKLDWPTHKLLCKQFQTFLTPPSESHRRAIFFPVNEKRPRFEWVACKLCDDEDALYEDFDKKIYIGDSFRGQLWVGNNKIRSRDLRNMIEVVFREAGLVDGSATNRSVIEVTKGLAPHAWPGPILVMKLQGMVLEGRYGDMDTADFRDVVDFFTSYGDPNYIAPDLDMLSLGGSSKTPVEQVAGVRINCRGDQDVRGGVRFEEIKVPKNHSVFHEQPTSVSKLLGMPICVQRCPPDKSLRGKDYSRVNQAATFLHLVADPASKQWGWASFEWQEPTGSVIVVREDRKPLLRQHVDALCYFCRHFMGPIFEDSIGGGFHPENPLPKEEVLARLTPRGFQNFYTGYSNWRRESDPEWEFVGHPDQLGTENV